MVYSGVSCRERTWDMLLPNGSGKEKEFCAERGGRPLISHTLDSPGCLYCPSISHHAGEIPREVQQQVREMGTVVARFGTEPYWGM